MSIWRSDANVNLLSVDTDTVTAMTVTAPVLRQLHRFNFISSRQQPPLLLWLCDANPLLKH